MSEPPSDPREDESPYTSPLCTIFFGDSKTGYPIHNRLVDGYPPLAKLFRGSQGRIWLNDVHESVAHTFISYLYTKEFSYEASGDNIIDFQFALRLIYAAGTYGLSELSEKAHELREEAMDSGKNPEILNVAKAMHMYFRGSGWYPDMIKSAIEAGLKYGHPTCLDPIIDALGENREFEKVVMNVMAEILMEKLCLKPKE
ncbi:hypothetical protein H112_07021 [Trichophyton rubrum D6]|uniref:BTB domain-containing protein n=3 Tax=Trichophyton rubrum TaxID=5551 RepID=A0A178EZS5_TRIRU|nr:uncharacterized protein TERG_02364 [Trichophyton rubrum CBS 118892]EZF11959.1 hypothetical protein H100_07044 [Trichophyton rubrum MR850]EZF38820.1 hypothetical protein H102_07007 [Trichophyton rubrum CBS 100081]EZF49452.1 hypothetical protein H103_07029 [Trichophyton rubrum CBS 288.86]EZF60060.1 hypothetical protein H104_06984 [Trichophyton rubrum CBS 289.86]EZF81463.1 hypothetical protein H110_07025 [Trichophyton rubrum MR1448]EZF92021.1 hypothetical protein H113_07080 [Trichophyton rubr